MSSLHTSAVALNDGPARRAMSTRALATGLLMASVALYVLARAFEHLHPAIPFVRAFAEAATIGGLADWFAVTALFRRPLGLPIPHTAIIPRSKDRIGRGLGKFLEENFLKAELVADRLADTDLAGEAARFLSVPERRKAAARMIADLAPRALDLVDDEAISTAIAAALRARLKAADVGGLLADLIALFTAQQRHRPIVDRLIVAAYHAINRNAPEIRRRVRDETGWFSRLLSIDKRASEALIEAACTGLREAAEDPEHQWRQEIDAALQRLMEDLRAPNPLNAEAGAIRDRLLADDEVLAYLGAVWRHLKQEIRAAAASPEMRLEERIEEALAAFAARLEQDETLREAVNSRLRLWAVRLAESRGADVAHFVSETIRSWDAGTMIERIEAGVGADLQYIRISGALVGGVAGVALHTFSVLAFGHG